MLAAAFALSSGILSPPSGAASAPSALLPPTNPTSNYAIDDCVGTDTTGCLAEINAARFIQEGLSPISLPSNWSSLSGPEQMFVFTNLERTSRGEAAIPNLVSTFTSQVTTAMLSDNDPVVNGVQGNRGSIWAGGMPSVIGAFGFWMYYDGPGGINLDCTTSSPSGCWGHRDVILADANYLGNPQSMDAVAGDDSGGSPSFAAELLVGSGYSPVVFTWAGEQPYLSSQSIGSAPAAGIDANGTQYVFWKGTNGSLMEKWYTPGHGWFGPVQLNSGQLGSAPGVAVYPDGDQDVFWAGTNGNLDEMWYSGAWNGPANLGSGLQG